MPAMKAQNYDDELVVGIHVDAWDDIMAKLRRLEFVPGFCLTMKDGEPALGLVLKVNGHEECICSFKRPVSGREKGLQ
jgi:hypothetical protein